MKGEFTMICDRCLEEFQMPVETDQTMLVRFGEPGIGETDDIIVISRNDHELNVAQHIYDYLSLLVPMRVVHPDDENGVPGCNQEIIDKLEARNKEKENQGDPRWDALKKLGFNEN
jgi:uncharacterized metal-binding protein YceD (DUF177 family)